VIAHARTHVIAYIALFFAMTGTSMAASAMWTGTNIVDGSLTGTDVLNGSLTGSDIQNGSITPSDLSTTGTSPAAEPWHQVGAAGEPPLLDPFIQPSDGYASPGFYRDQNGRVWLKGTVASTNSSYTPNATIFVLPTGYRPSERLVVSTTATTVNPDGGYGQQRVAIEPDGRVTTGAPTGMYTSLDGVSLRPAP
jgi:hypothetical protein